MLNLGLAAVLGPAERGGVVDGVLDVEAGAALDEQAHGVEVAVADGLVQGRGVRVEAFGVEAVGIFARVKEQADDFGVAVLGGEGERTMPGESVGSGQKSLRVGEA